MKYLVIENKVECAPEAFLLMGASTKRSQSGQIGQFGTGFDYALAVLMREKIATLVVSGNTRWTFGTDTLNFRGQDFERITVREGRKKPEPTNITTSLGLQWSLSGALRELVSNAYDEPDAYIYVSGEVMARPGYTRVYVQLTEAVNQVYREFDRYFTFRRTPLISGDGWAVYDAWGPGTRVYRRGVLVYEDTELPACFDYRSDDLEVREDRTADRYNCERAAAWIMRGMDIDQMGKVTEFLTSTSAATFEGANNYLDWYADGMAEKFAGLINGRVLVSQDQATEFSAELASESIFILPSKWVEAFGKRGNIRTLKDVVSAPRLRGHKTIALGDLTMTEKYRLAASLDFAKAAGIEIDPFKITAFEADSDSAPLGYALVNTGEILLNRKVLVRTVQEIVEVLFEEFVHNDSQNSDYTRGFQNCLIRHWVNSLTKFIPMPALEADEAAA